MKNKIELLNRIARMAMLHASSITNVGLLNGKLGVCLFFYRYSRFTGRSWYADFAGELLDEIYGEIHSGYSLNFKDGLPGICWGFEYLIRNDYVDADPDEILGDLDARIFERNIGQLSDCSLETGLTGLAHYILSRSTGKPHRLKFCSDDYLADMISGLKTGGAERTLVADVEALANDLTLHYSFELLDKICSRSKTTPKAIFSSYSLGIINQGITGSAFRILNELSQ